jgi:hypothetical protein
MEKEKNGLKSERAKKNQPEVGKSYWVQCKGYRCLAVYEKDGKWHSAYRDEILTDVSEHIAF